MLTDSAVLPRPVDRSLRYVALGDSSTEGLDDPGGARGYRGWSERLGTHLAAARGAILYANLGVRGKRTREVRDEQLEAALAMKPDLATLFVGTNDVTARSFDEARFVTDLTEMQSRLRGRGATVLGFTLPDLAPVMPLARLVTGRVARLNDRIREVSAQTGSLVVDFARRSITSDPRLWSDDRIHANSLGHERMAAALADALGLPGHGHWDEPLADRVRPSRLVALRSEVAWFTRHLLPWIGRGLTGRTLHGGGSPKYPTLVPWGEG